MLWFLLCQPQAPSGDNTSQSPPVKQQLVTAFQNQAAQLLENEVNIYQKGNCIELSFRIMETENNVHKLVSNN